MIMASYLKKSLNISEGVIRYFCYLGYVAIALMAISITFDVSSRFLNYPFTGGPEIVEQLMVLVVFFVLPYVSMVEGHIKVDFLISYLNRKMPRLQKLFNGIFELLMTIMISFLAWESWLGSYTALQSGECSDALRIPNYPFRIVLAIGFSLTFFSLFLKLIHKLIAKVKEYHHVS